ncbi:hypothetical protein [Zavarzinella formosa]|uniref:hypothetical protein n=1 Tax=Zavarzinella formosa TaxID=360055 RepID=UPI0002E25D41|nr:hypothetical protein [Zavarzinella formosa]
MFSLSLTSVRHKLIIAIAVLAGAAFVPDKADAGCGDYNMPEMPPGIGHLAANHGPAPVKPKCHGPDCSKKPVTPAPLHETPVRVSTGGNDLACIAFDTNHLAIVSRPFPTDQALLSPVRLTDMIYHPPR